MQEHDQYLSLDLIKSLSQATLVLFCYIHLFIFVVS